MKALLRFQKVGMRFDRTPVLENFDLDIYPGNVIGLLGPSGVGKSTLLKIMAGILQPTEGVFETRVSRVAYVFQEPRILPWKTALDNVSLVLRARGLSRVHSLAKAHHWLERVGLQGYADYYPTQLSGGMLQRVTLARAFAVEPDLLLLDEPFSALDPGLKEILVDMIQQMLEEQPITLIYVSHSPEEVIRLANRIFMLFSRGVMEELPVDTDDSFKAFLKDAFLITA